MKNQMVDRNPVLCQTFVREAKAFFYVYPQIQHKWSIDADEDHCILDIPEEHENGFSVTVEVHPDTIMVIASGAHTSLNITDYENTDELVAHALGLVRDLLSPAMRIRERLAGGEPYKWAFEINRDGIWFTEEWVGLFFWNYFGKRSEKIYQNNILPSRDR